MKNTKYIFITLKERNGEYEYLHRSVHQLPDNKITTAKKFAGNYLKGFYRGKAEKEDGGYYFYSREIFVQEYLWCFVSKEIFNVLKQYL